MVLQSQNESSAPPPLGMVTYAEIFQQPELWPSTFDIVRNSGWADNNVNRPVIITGAGTSAYAASAIAASWANAQAVPTTSLLIESRDEIERRSPDFKHAGLLISLARSGDSPESVAVVERIRRMYPQVEHLAITCNAKGQLATASGIQSIVLDPRTNDRGLAMTSSFSNLVLAGLCLRHAQELEGVLPSLCADLQRQFPDLNAQAKRLSSEPIQRVVVLASGPLQSLATETSLKILEMTAGKTATLAETFLGLRHGPMSFLTSNTLVLCFLSSSMERRRYEEDLINELRQKQLGRIVGIAPASAQIDLFDEWVPAISGGCRDELRIPFEVPFSQLLAFHLSLKAGLDPDNPSPMGAITRVVQKFVIYDEESNV